MFMFALPMFKSIHYVVGKEEETDDDDDDDDNILEAVM
jgi:hypothetical protein